jgi:pimeloyl-ACP methyl ester carboxylesterase
MSNLPSAFKSPKGEAEYMVAYEASMRLWTVANEGMDIPSRFGCTHLVVCGPKDAPPLVLLHCFDTSLTVWAYNIADLSRDYRVYALDMMGQPSKSIPDQPIRNREEMAEWLTGVLDALKIRQTDLIGYSFGGFAALNYAMRAPDRLKRLILLSPAGGLVPLKTQFYIRGMLSAVIPSNRFTAKVLWFNWFFYGPNLKNEKTRRIFDLLVNQFALGLRYFRMGVAVLPLAYKDEELQRVNSPTLLLVGQQEALYDPVAAVERAKRLIPCIQTELIPHASHDMPVSQPGAVNQRILEFLQRYKEEILLAKPRVHIK